MRLLARPCIESRWFKLHVYRTEKRHPSQSDRRRPKDGWGVMFVTGDWRKS